MLIAFGTDGWRGKIGEVFTDANLGAVAQATCDYLKEQGASSSFVVVGYDRRFRSEEFADIVAEIFSSNGFNVLLSSKDVSTPVVSYVTNRFKAAIGVCITASHNPASYNGYKLKENFGGSALTETIDKIVPYLNKHVVLYGDKKNITKVDFTTEYFANFRAMFNLDLIASHFEGTPVHLNYMHGSAAGYVGEVLRGQYVPLYEYNLNRDAHFGGLNPEPIPANLSDFIKSVGSGIGFAFDGDGDRICAVAHQHPYVSSSQIMAVLIPYLAQRHSASKVVKTVSCSRLVDLVAKSCELEIQTSKIGFKYIAAEMLKDRNILIGGEESGGIGFYGYLPERDGIANCLLTMEALAYENKTLGQALEDLEEEFGPCIQDRIDLKLSAPSQSVKERIEHLKECPEKLLSGVDSVQTIDGIRLNQTNGDWLMLRLSGTEPVVRIYAESSSVESTQSLIQKAKAYINA